LGGGINPIIKKLNKKNVITYRIAYNFRCSRGSHPYEDL
jgi:hypothetical protein